MKKLIITPAVITATLFLLPSAVKGQMAYTSLRDTIDRQITTQTSTHAITAPILGSLLDSIAIVIKNASDTAGANKYYPLTGNPGEYLIPSSVTTKVNYSDTAVGNPRIATPAYVNVHSYPLSGNPAAFIGLNNISATAPAMYNNTNGIVSVDTTAGKKKLATHYYVDSAVSTVSGGGGAVSSVFGRNGAVAAAAGDYTFSQLGSIPTTLAGYGITDAYSKSTSDSKYLQSYVETDPVAGAKTVTVSAGMGISVTGAAQAVSSNPAFTITAQNTAALWNANKLQGIAIATVTPTSGQVLSYNGTNWAPATGGGGSTPALQQVTDAGATTTDDITVKSLTTRYDGSTGFTFSALASGYPAIYFSGASGAQYLLTTDGSGLYLNAPGSGYAVNLRVNGTTYASVNASLGTGALYSNSGALTNTNPSDSNLKDHITDLPYGLNEILLLKPKKFHYKTNDTAVYNFGFIAQDVRPVFPDAIGTVRTYHRTDSTPKDTSYTDYLGLDKDAIWAAQVKALQEMEAQILSLQAEVADLKK